MATTKKINDGFIKLTKENISKGQLGDKIKSISGSDKVLTTEELLNARRNIIPDEGIGEDIYIFAYGSLLKYSYIPFPCICPRTNIPSQESPHSQ